jgi:hypothetical protein
MVHRATILWMFLLIIGCGRVERVMIIDSTPPGALVFMNDQEIGRTPLKRDFTWYGYYDVRVRREGFETKRTTTRVIAPWWQWPPFDLLAEIVPGRWKDHRHYHYRLSPAQEVDPDEMLGRAEQMRLRLQSSEHTRVPGTRPSTQSTQPATTQGATP